MLLMAPPVARHLSADFGSRRRDGGEGYATRYGSTSRVCKAFRGLYLAVVQSGQPETWVIS
jgi:hypothetical protein